MVGYAGRCEVSDAAFDATGAIFHRGVRVGWIEETAADWVLRWTHHPTLGRRVGGTYRTERQAREAALAALVRRTVA